MPVPPANSTEAIRYDLATQGYSLFARESLALPEEARRDVVGFADTWNALPKDRYMRDRGRYRERRFGRFRLEPCRGALGRLPHTAFFQSEATNRFAGGVDRWFEPLQARMADHPLLRALIFRDFDLLPLTPDDRYRPWTVLVQQYRILASATEAGQPTPEGMHRDGFDYVAMHLISRHQVEGGTSHVFDNGGSLRKSHTLEHCLDSLVVDDQAVLHAADPVVPVSTTVQGYRDMLILDYQRDRDVETCPPDVP